MSAAEASAGTPQSRHREFPAAFDTELEAARAAADRTQPAPQRKTLARLEDIEFLVGYGEAPESIAVRTGFASVASMERLLYRHNRADLIERMMQHSCRHIPRSARTMGTRVRMSR